MDCPICFSAPRRIFQKYGYWICKCTKCDHRFTEMIPSPEHTKLVFQDKYFKGGAAGYPDYLGEEKIITGHGTQYAALLKEYTTPGVMLDVGAAAGFILKGFKDAGWQGIGLEPNASMTSYARSNLGLKVETGSLESFSSTQKFELISMIQVIAHFSNIRLALQNAANATQEGGFWLIESWDRGSLVARLLGRYWHEYSPPSVLNWFSASGVKDLAGQYGFSEIARGRPRKRINGAHFKSLLEYKLKDMSLGWMKSGLGIIPNQMTIPYPAFDIFWMLFQKTKR